MRRKGLSLRWQMMLIIVILPLLLLGPLLFVAGAEFRDEYREARLGKGHMITQQLRQNIDTVSPFIASVRDIPGLERYLRDSVKDQPELAFTALVREDGIIIMHAVPGMSGRMLLPLPPVEVTTLQTHLQQYGALHLVVRRLSRPDTTGQALYAVVGAYSAIVDPPWLPWLPVAGTILLALLLLVVLQVFVQRALLSPLDRLAEAAAIVGAGDLAFEINLNRHDEIGFVAQAFNDMGERLRQLVTTLEQQVAARTADLERRNRQLQAVSLVAREAVRIEDVSSLLDTTVYAISRQFGYYHAGIFWIDQTGEWAVLRAASSEGGQRMLRRGHRLRVGQQGLVGTVAALGQPRIALDVGEDAVWFDNPDLPETRSELALPLFDVEHRVLGVLDVQSTEVSAFTPADVEVLQLLADQVSVALRNAQLLEQMRGTLQELQSVQQDYRREGWARVMSRRHIQAYEYDGVVVQPVLPLPVPAQVLTSLGSVRHVETTPQIMEPLRYLDETIGLLTLSDPDRVWTEEELSLVRSVTDQVASALEAARLFEETQRSARQQMLLNAVLQTAALTLDPDQALEEIARILARGLAMAVGVFTFPRVAARADGATLATEVRLQAFVSPTGEPLLPAGRSYPLPLDQQIFFRGLTEPELGKWLPLGEVPTLTEAYDLERILYVPIRTATAQAGFVALVRQRQDVLLDPETRVLARNLAGQVAVVLENLHLLEETQRRSAELQALYELSLRLGKVLDVAETQQLVVEQAPELLEADGAALLLYSERDEELRFVVSTGVLAPYLHLRLRPGEGVSGKVFVERQIVRIADYRHWDERVSDLEVGPMLGVPLIAARGVIGVLLIARRPAAPAFDDTVSRLAELFAAQIMVALENARLYEESARRARDLQQLYEAGLNMISIREIQGVLDAGANWALRLLNVERVRIFFWPAADATPLAAYAVSAPEYAPPETLQLPRPDGLTEEIRRTGKAQLIHDATQDPRFSPQLLAVGLISQIAVPLRLGTDTVGALFATSTQRAYFTEETVTLLEFLGSQLATSAQNALQFAQLQQTLAAVEMQARYRDAVAQATAQLAERGTESMPVVLELLGATLQVEQALFCELRAAESGLYWEPVAHWMAQPSPAVLKAPSSKWRLDAFPEWASALRSRGILQVNFSDATALEQQALTALGFRSLLLVAVPGEADVPHFIALGDARSERVWRSEELVSVQTVATALSSTLARERLFREVQAALAETEMLYRAGGALNAAQTYAQILDVMREYTVLGTGAHLVAVLLYDRPWTESQRPTGLSLAARWTFSSEYDAGLLGRLGVFAALEPHLRRDSPHVIGDLERDLDIADPARALLGDILQGRTVLFVPLVVAGQAIGTFVALFGTVTRFKEEELRRLRTIAGQAAIAIQNIYQLQATAARARREQLIREIGEQLQAAPDVQSVLQTATRELGRALGAPRAVVRLGSVGERRRKKSTGDLLPQTGELVRGDDDE